MKRSLFSSVIGLSMLCVAGCQDGSLSLADQDSVDRKIKVCQTRDPETGGCADNNGSEIFNPEKPDYSFGIQHSDWAGQEYRLTGFYPGVGGWKVRGWHVDNTPGALDPHIKGDGQVVGLILSGSLFQVKNMKAHKTSLLVQFCDAANVVCDTLNVDQMYSKGAELLLALPNPGGRGETQFRWTFQSGQNPVEYIKSWGGDVFGQYVYTAAKGQIPTSLCKKTAGADEYVVFQQGSLWDPDTFQRTVDPLAITVACEEGAIAEGLARGYTPWSTGTQDDGALAVMADWQQSFIRMKTDDYCGMGHPHTVDGTKYLIHAPLDPSRDRDPIGKLEAFWGPDGAFCVVPGNRRHPEIPMACAIPDCDAATIAARTPSNLRNGIP